MQMEGALLPFTKHHPWVVMAPIFLGILFCGCSAGNSSRRDDPRAPFIDGMSISPYPNGRERQAAMASEASIEIRLAPSARPGHADFRLAVNNSGEKSVWLEPSAITFKASPDLVVKKIYCVKTKENGEEIGGLAVSALEISPMSKQFFYIGIRWDDISVPKFKTPATLELTFTQSNHEISTIPIQFNLGPSPYAR